MNKPRKKVLYIVGAQNSGSTMLDTLLSGADSSYGLGEVGRIHAISSTALCNCGKSPSSCAPCGALVEAIDSAGLTEKLTTIFPRSLKEKSLIRHLSSGSACKEYAAISDLIIDSVANSTSSGLLIDSSKNVSRAIALARASQHEIFFLHFVRDGRGYINSRNSPSRLKRLNNKPAFVSLIWKWIMKNLLATLFLQPYARKFMIMRYEDFINRPQDCIRKIEKFIDFNLSSVCQALESGAAVERQQIFETPRAISYSSVKIEPRRLESQKFQLIRNLTYLIAGGFLGALWGYGVSQDYIEDQKHVF